MDCSTCSSSINVVLEPTTSRCLTKSTTATHNFEVANFSLLDGMGAGKFVSSSTFSVGGGDWHVRLYPDGDKPPEKGTPASVSIFVCFLGGDAGIRCKLSVGLLDANNNNLMNDQDHHQNLNFEPAGDNNNTNRREEWGWSAFMRKSTLKCTELTVSCVLTVIKSHMEDMNTIVVPPPSLHEDLARMLRDGEGTDVALVVVGGGETETTLHAHASILTTRCAVFRALLVVSETKEKAARRVVVEDMVPAVLDWLLYYLYTDSLPDHCYYEGDEGGDNKAVAMQHLPVAADRYGLHRLRLLCEARLCSWIDVESVAATLVLADQHQCLQLKDACLRFIAWREVLPAVMKTDGFQHLANTCPVIMSEILSKVASPDASHS
ncbi:hypothetical protein PR202_gb14312 [Eleusine coracana subsp. coracana]|uniref:Uncharacterized protein n=1 Tax=Eleusine coracana subsp. coracana TaxID=191504 RepID=A0AAV5EVZ2_ELECO|nr:hypothetical protein QOZ80_4BG0334130 [Eleusine coracana subsp. coracana]GJN26385.1 hypothetical protein PR202_gb14312 [Eleusine coracana subsp. coracana]